MKVFFLVLEINCLNQSFCEYFAKNNFKISYPFRRIFAHKSDIYLIINGFYWKLVFIDHKEDQNKTVKISESEFGYSGLFARPSSMAFCVWFDDRCKAGRFDFKWIIFFHSKCKKLKLLIDCSQQEFDPILKQSSGPDIIDSNCNNRFQ